MSKWQAGDDDLGRPYICGNCLCFVSTELSAEVGYEDVGVCEMRARCPQYELSEYAILRNDNPAELGCTEWRSI